MSACRVSVVLRGWGAAAVLLTACSALSTQGKAERLAAQMRDRSLGLDAQSRAASQLVRMGGKAVGALAQMLSEDDTDLVELACIALALIGPKASDAVPALIPLVKHDHLRVRAVAMVALETIGPAARDASPALLEALDDPDPQIRSYAAEALVGIGYADAERIRELLAEHERASDAKQ